MFDQNMSTD